jgi:hypothetical protein
MVPHKVVSFATIVALLTLVTLLRASSYEPSNRAGSITGTNFVVCSYGKFQPGRPGWNSRNQTKMVPHKVVSFATIVALLTLVTLLIELIRILLKWKYIQGKNYAILASMLRSFVPVTRTGVFILEDFHPGYRDLGNRVARLLIWTHRNFYKGNGSSARFRTPSHVFRNLEFQLEGGYSFRKFTTSCSENMLFVRQVEFSTLKSCVVQHLENLVGWF